MKPSGGDLLAPLFRPLATLPAVTPALLRQLRRLLGRPDARVIDLLALAPVGIVDPRPLPELRAEHIGAAVTLDCVIGPHRPSARPPAPWRIEVAAAGRTLQIVLFNVRGDWPLRRFVSGRTLRLHGRVTRWDGQWQLAHPEPLPTTAEAARPVYRLSEGLSQARLRQVLAGALATLPELPEWHDTALLRRERWPTWRVAVRALHAPDAALAPERPERRRLAYDELLATQVALRLTRRGQQRDAGRVIESRGRLRAALLASLPFRPTAAQNRAVAEILADLRTATPMLRLVMGDVGSGKTLVALLAMLEAVEAGGQAALMAPTEVLARQHAASLVALAAPLGIGIERLTGKETPAERRQTLTRLRTGEAKLVVGTHALFQDQVAFADLALAVIDEQHRFGVHQRLRLKTKGAAVDLLLLTATPIPRTLLMSAYGDIATSRLDEKPSGRLPIRTAVLPGDRLAEVVEALARALDRGEQAYWICPLIEGDGEDERAAAEARAQLLRERFGDAVGLVHGRMVAADKAAAMAAFAGGRTRLLVATTVIEVGVDVPKASVIVIEEAERFGLSQLHQLRGRVGRGSAASHCLLLFTPPLTATARERLRVLRETEDGFRIAEEDLRLRGPGELLGSRQSGLPAFRFADLAVDRDLLGVAVDDARHVLAGDPELAGPRGRALRLLLALFERDDATSLLAAG